MFEMAFMISKRLGHASGLAPGMRLSKNPVCGTLKSICISLIAAMIPSTEKNVVS